MKLASAAVVVLLCSGFAAPVFADDGGNSQQSKMAQCNQDAAGKKGDERKAFMKGCLMAKPAPRDRMKVCNARAHDMKGDARKDFMKSCLSN